MSAHTPYPWVVGDKEPGDLFRYVFHAAPREWHAICRTSINGNPHAEADARLIAAAPELLAALVKIAARFDSAIFHGSIEWQTHQEAIAAIAKATQP